MSTTPLSMSSSDEGTPSKRIKLSPRTESCPVAMKKEESFSSLDSSTIPGIKAEKRPSTRPPPQIIDLKTPLSDKILIKKRAQGITKLMKLLEKKKKIVVVAGAGISVGAGIPDFRGSAGLFSTLRTEYKLKSSGKELFDANVYKANGSTSDFHDMIRNLHAMVDKAQPTTFHHLLASLAAEGRLLRLYTQNVDGIETSMEPLKSQIPLSTKAPWPKTVQLHGALGKMVCSRCKWMADFKPELFSGPSAPDCPDCQELDEVREMVGKRTLGIGKLRPRMVLYNEENPDADAIGAVTNSDLKTRPDAVLVVGTSLKIPGVRRIVREMCGTAQHIRGGITAWINEDDPPPGKEFENIFDLIVKGDCETVARLANLPRFDGSASPNTSENPMETILKTLDSQSQPATPVVELDTPPPPFATPSVSPHPPPVKATRKRKAAEPASADKPPKRRKATEPKPSEKTASTSKAIEPRTFIKPPLKRKAEETPPLEQATKKKRTQAPEKPKVERKRKATVPKGQVASVDKLFRAAKSAPNTPSKRSCRDTSKPSSSEDKLAIPVLNLQHQQHQQQQSGTSPPSPPPSHQTSDNIPIVESSL